MHILAGDFFFTLKLFYNIRGENEDFFFFAILVAFPALGKYSRNVQEVEVPSPFPGGCASVRLPPQLLWVTTVLGT